MKKLILLPSIMFMISCLPTRETTSTSNNSSNTSSIKIAFGSCAKETQDQPLLNVAAGLNPDVFIYLGDNIYGDTKDMEVLKSKYGQLAAKPEFQNLRNQTTVYATWDDHDYGANDAGRHYPFKTESKEIFMDFWNVPADSDRRKHEGIYGVEYFKKNGLKIQMIILDTRTFRDDLIFRTKGDPNSKNDYAKNAEPDSTFLGSVQWEWLEAQFKEKADIRIIASSNQFGHEYNGWESWTNVPHEQQKMIDLIAKTKANGVVFISGDVHWGEISKMTTDSTYDIYDVTSSGITQTWYNVEPNKNRVGEPVSQNNVGLIEIEKQNGTVSIMMEIYDITKQAVVQKEITLKDISF